MKYKLSEFNLNKQSLKRKLKEITNKSVKETLILLLERRTTKYNLDEIETIIDGFYSNTTINSKQPLSIYYGKHNKEKYNELKSFLEIKKTGSIDSSLKKDIKRTFETSKNTLMTFDEYTKELEKISKRYNISIKEIYNITNKLEDTYIEKLIIEENLNYLKKNNNS
jgi:hypothetical protein